MGDLLSHRNLLAWQEAIKLVEIVYRETSDFPKIETFGLASQLRRSAVSISANIAEGVSRPENWSDTLRLPAAHERSWIRIWRLRRDWG